MALSPISSGADWAQEIGDAAEAEMNAVIDIVTPGTPGTWNPETDVRDGASGDIPVITARKARIQHIRLPLETAGSSEWSTKRRYRFQIPLLESDPLILKGMIVRVSDGGRDATLENFVYEVISAANSSHAALRTVETVCEWGVVGG